MGINFPRSRFVISRAGDKTSGDQPADGVTARSDREGRGKDGSRTWEIVEDDDGTGVGREIRRWDGLNTRDNHEERERSGKDGR